MTKRNDQQEETRLVAIRAAIGPVLAAHAVELCDLGWFQEAGGRTLRLTIERPAASSEGPAASSEGPAASSEGAASEAGAVDAWVPERGFGVNLDDCAKVSRDVSAALDELEAADATLLPAEYLLEVSSPGLDRPLRGARDFVRFRGALAKVKLAKPAPDGQRVLRGVIVEASQDHVAMTVDGKRVEVPLADVAAANLVFELPSEPKRAQGPKTAPGPKAAAPKAAAPKATNQPRQPGRPKDGRVGEGSGRATGGAGSEATKTASGKGAHQKKADSKADTTVKGSIRHAG